MHPEKTDLKKGLLDDEAYDPYERHKPKKNSKKKSKRKKSKKSKKKRKSSIPICGILNIR